MIIRKYGIELRRVTQADIELIRQMRNRYDIRRTMFHQQHITVSQQERWFHSINNTHNVYCVIYDRDKPVGLANSKNIDWQKREEEGGLFMWDRQASGIAPKAAIIMMQLGFDIAGIQRSISHVRDDNQPAQQFNKALGYTPLKEQFWQLTRLRYLARKQRLLLLASGGKSISPLSCSDIHIETTNSPLYSGFPADVLRQLDASGSVSDSFPKCDTARKPTKSA